MNRKPFTLMPSGLPLAFALRSFPGSGMPQEP